MEAFLAQILPDLEHDLIGATEDEIAQIEELAGRELPRFYRWFLMRMGRKMGALEYGTIDFSAAAVMASYRERLFHADPRVLMIGRESDEMMPLHVVYDFEHLARNDARVAKRHSLGGEFYPQFETLREMLAWGACMLFHVEAMPYRCVGLLRDPDEDVLARLDPVMRSLGFANPVATGACCSLYLGERAGMVTRTTPGRVPKIHTFRLGGADQGALRRILGVIGSDTSLEVSVDEWLSGI